MERQLDNRDERIARIRARWAEQLRTLCETLIRVPRHVVRTASLTHSLADAEGDVIWLERLSKCLAEEYGLAVTIRKADHCATVCFQLDKETQ